MATWSRGYIESDSSSGDRREWDEPWTALDANVPAGTPPLTVLLADRPDLSHGTPHPTEVGVYVADVTAEEIVKGSDCYEVTVRWSRQREEIDLSLPPHLRPAVIELAYESVEVPTFTQQNGDAWQNTAGDLLGDITRTENHWVFSVSKNVLALPTWLLTYADAVNSDEVTIKGLTIQPEYLLLKDLRVPLNKTTEEVGGITHEFYVLSFSLVYNPRTWKTVALNRGLYEIDPTDGYRRIEIPEGEPVDEPQFLDADGALLPQPVDPGDIVTVEGWNHELLPFNALPLT